MDIFESQNGCKSSRMIATKMHVLYLLFITVEHHNIKNRGLLFDNGSKASKRILWCYNGSYKDHYWGSSLHAS